MTAFEDFDRQAEFYFRAYDAGVSVKTNRPQIFEKIKTILPPTAIEAPGGKVDCSFALEFGGQSEDWVVIRRNGESVGEGCEEAWWLDTLANLFKMAISEFSPDRVFVHAGSLVWNGRAVVLPGRSHAGKTTLTAALIRAGAEYYSDEYAVLDEDGTVYPYPKPLSIREKSLHNRQVDRPVESFGGRQGALPARIGAVVLTEYEPGAEWDPIFLSRGEGVLALLANTVSAQINPAFVMQVLPKAIADAVIVKSKRGEAEAVARNVLALLERDLRAQGGSEENKS